MCRRNVWVDYPRTGPVAILKTHHHVARSAGFAHPPTTSPDGATAQPLQGCGSIVTVPRVAPRRRNPGLFGRIPLGFPEGDFSTFPLSAFICTKCGCLFPCRGRLIALQLSGTDPFKVPTVGRLEAWQNGRGNTAPEPRRPSLAPVRGIPDQTPPRPPAGPPG